MSVSAALKELYEKSPAAFSSAQRLYEEAKANNIKITYPRLKRLMTRWQTFSKFQVKYKKAGRRDRVIVPGPYHLLQIDLAFLSKYRNFIGIIIAIDCFSRKVVARAIKSKRSKEIVDKMKEIFGEIGAPPNLVNSDAGKEFVNSDFAQLAKEFRFFHFVSNSTQKGQFVERCIRSFRRLLRRKLYHEKSRNWVDHYAWVIEKMNARRHSAIGMSPNSVSVENADVVFARLYPDLARRRQPPTGLRPLFTIGDTVRILRPPAIFEKGDIPKATDAVYKIARILFHPTIRYKLSDLETGNLIVGSFNEQELVSSPLPQQP